MKKEKYIKPLVSVKIFTAAEIVTVSDNGIELPNIDFNKKGKSNEFFM